MTHYLFTAPELAAHLRALADRQTKIARALQAARGGAAAEVNYYCAVVMEEAAKLIEEHLCARQVAV